MADGTNKTVSIIIPVYNAEKYIEQTIDCVLKQTYEDWELLLVENGSTDATVSVIIKRMQELDDQRIKLIQMQENAGAARARNKGLEESKGRYIAYLDADDIWLSNKLEKEIAFATEKKAAFVFTGYEFADEDALGTGKIVHVPDTINYKQALGNTTIFTTTVMFDTNLIPKDMLDMPIIKSEDTALWWKVLRNGYLAYGLDENLALYRRAGKTLSSNKFEALRRIWNLYRKAENMGICSSMYYFCLWAVNAVKRRV